MGALRDDGNGTPGTHFDQIVRAAGGGTLDLVNGQVALAFPGINDPNSGDPFWQTTHTWTILMLADGGNASNFGGLSNAAAYAGAGTFGLSLVGPGHVLLTFTPVPEPAALVVFGVGTVAACLWRRRR